MRKLLTLAFTLFLSQSAYALTDSQIDWKQNETVIAATGDERINHLFGSHTANLAPGGTKTYFLYGRNDLLRQEDYVRGVYVYIGSGTVTDLRLVAYVERPVAGSQTIKSGTFDKKWVSADLSSQIVANSENFLVTDISPFELPVGTAFAFQVTSASGNVFDTDAVTASLADGFHKTSLVTYNGAAPDVATWTTISGSYSETTQTTIPALIITRSPQGIFYGDSLYSGSTLANSYSCPTPAANANCGQQDLSPERFADLNLSITGYFKGRTGLIVQNMAIAGQVSSQLVDRKQTIIDMNPDFVVIEIGVNDVSIGVSVSTIIANVTGIIDSFEAAGIQTILIGRQPWTGGTNTQNATLDTLDAAYQALAALYTNVVYVDVCTTIGQTRSGGSPTPPATNCWDLKTIYNSGDNIHQTPAAYDKQAELIVNAVRKYIPPSKKPAQALPDKKMRKLRLSR